VDELQIFLNTYTLTSFCQAKKGELKNKYNYVKNIEVYKINTENAYVQNILKDLKEVK